MHLAELVDAAKLVNLAKLVDGAKLVDLAKVDLAKPVEPAGTADQEPAGDVHGGGR